LHGFVLDKSHTAVDFLMDGITVRIRLDEICGNQAESGYGLILEEQQNTFPGTGKRFRVSLTPMTVR